MSNVDDLKKEKNTLWQAATTHSFISELGDGTLPAEKFRRYFLQDYLFVRDLVKAAALATSRAPDLAAARPIISFLNGILDAEDSLFRDAFRTLEIPEKEFLAAEALPTTAAFGNFLVRLGYEATFAEICCALYVAEGVYLDWGERLRREGADPAASGAALGRFYEGWIALHTAGVLGGIVSYLENVVNAAAPTEMPRLGHIFERALRYEVAFWDMAYHGEKWL